MGKYNKLAKGIGVVKNDTCLSYRVHFKLNGKAVTKILKLPVSPKNNREAIRIKALIDHYADETDLASINEFIRVALPLRQNPDLINNLLKDWLEDIRKNLPDSFVAYKKDHDKCSDKLGHLTIQELAEDPEPYFNWVQSMGNLTYKTINNRVRPLKQIFVKALITKKINSNPIDVKIRDIVRAKKSQRVIDPYTEKEIWILIDKARKIGDQDAANYIQANFYNGLRPEEMMGQEWPDFSLKDRKFKVQRAVAERRLKGTKTDGSERILDMNDYCLEAYKEQWNITGWANKRVWRNPTKGGDLVDYETINGWLMKLCKLADIRYRSSKQLRKSYACNRLSQSKTIQEIYEVAAVLGHRGKGGNVDITTLMKDYADYMPKQESTSTFGQKIGAVSELKK